MGCSGSRAIYPGSTPQQREQRDQRIVNKNTEQTTKTSATQRSHSPPQVSIHPFYLHQLPVASAHRSPSPPSYHRSPSPPSCYAAHRSPSPPSCYAAPDTSSYTAPDTSQ